MSRDKKLKKLGKQRKKLRWWQELASSAPVRLAATGICVTLAAVKLLSPYGLALDMAVGAGAVLLGAAVAAAGLDGVSQVVKEKIRAIDEKAVALLPERASGEDEPRNRGPYQGEL